MADSPQDASNASNASTQRSTLIGLSIWIALCFGAAAIGTQFPPGKWHAELAKPDWNPPNWVFGPVWTALYLMMAIAVWLVWHDRGWSGARLAITLFLFQLVLNACWSWLFFGMHRPDLALVDIALLWLAIAATIGQFWQISRIAAYLLLPYLLWVTFATALNFSIWRLN